MAKVIQTDTEPRIIGLSYSLLRVIAIGVVSGFLYWLLTSLIRNYVHTLSTAGDIATILVATLGVIVMVRLRLAQPLIIAVVSAATLWGLADWTDGLSASEIVIWSMLLYVLAYALYSWVARYTKPMPVLATILIIVVIARIASVL